MTSIKALVIEARFDEIFPGEHKQQLAMTLRSRPRAVPDGQWGARRYAFVLASVALLLCITCAGGMRGLGDQLAPAGSYAAELRELVPDQAAPPPIPRALLRSLKPRQVELYADTIRARMAERDVTGLEGISVEH